MKRLILASQSPRRIELLRAAKYVFDIEPANVDEENYPQTILPSELAMQLARSKADVVATRFPDAVILAADTVVAFGDTIIGKPRDAEHARKIIELLNGTTQIVITGVCVICRVTNFTRLVRVMSAVRMKSLPRWQIDAHIESNLWQGKAGGYGIQDPDPLVECRSGDITNVVGLPMKQTQSILKEAGILPGN